MKYFVIRTFRGTCSSVGMLKGYMVRERLETPVIALEERCFVDMTSEHSYSVTMSDRRVTSQYHRFVMMLVGAGATRPT